jgi:hypothetical protein
MYVLPLLPMQVWSHTSAQPTLFQGMHHCWVAFRQAEHVQLHVLLPCSTISAQQSISQPLYVNALMWSSKSLTPLASFGRKDVYPMQ